MVGLSVQGSATTASVMRVQAARDRPSFASSPLYCRKIGATYDMLCSDVLPHEEIGSEPLYYAVRRVFTCKREFTEQSNRV